MSSKIDSLNQELAKKVGILFSVMQIHEIFSRGIQEEAVFQVILNKLKEVLDLSKAILILEKTVDKEDFIIFPGNESLEMKKLLDKEYFSRLAQLKKLLVLHDISNTDEFSFLKDILNIKNIFVKPLYSHNELKGFLIGGNELDDFVFSKEDQDSIEILSKNIILIWEHKRLSKTVEDLEIYDPLTGLYNKKHIETRLEEEVKRAVMYQRPCGLLLVEFTNLKEFQDKFGAIETEKLLKRIAKKFRDSLRSIDIPGRIEENKMAAILIEKNKRQCLKAAEEIKSAFQTYLKHESFKINFVFAAAENPVDGKTAKDLFNYAFANLRKKNEISQENN
jgi:diguanylate cyclase (GGDEF)-like protein